MEYMDFKTMTDLELAQIVVQYISRVQKLEDAIANYLDHSGKDTSWITEEYKELKIELKECAHYFKLKENQKGSDLYMHLFSPSIIDASAEGFSAPINGRINQSMFSSVAETRYKLTKYYSLKKWNVLLEKSDGVECQ